MVPRFLFECAIKLQIKPLTSASAAIIYHRFYREVQSADYDEYVSRVSIFSEYLIIAIIAVVLLLQLYRHIFGCPKLML